jgi:hypothetical protein
MLRVSFLLLFLFSACFRPRPVEPPPLQQSSDWISPVEHTQLISNFQTAVSLLNSQNYLRCINADIFKFNPVASLLAGNQLIWNNWTVNDEREYLENISKTLRPNATISLALSQPSVQYFGTDSIRYTATYKLRVPLQDTLLPELYSGQLEFILRRNTSREWEITAWSDFETAQDSSWSRLKLVKAQ